MTGFAERTGLIPPARPPRRYLWTDAFAVCNYLELFRQTGKEQYQQDAKRLVSQVHGFLGRHREEKRLSRLLIGIDPRGHIAGDRLGRSSYKYPGACSTQLRADFGWKTSSQTDLSL